MAHFARVVDGIVTRVHVLANDVITDADGVEQEELGKQFLAELHGYNVEELVQASYNNSFRNRFPGNGYEYHADKDAFIMPSQYASWVLNEETLEYEAPVPCPGNPNTDYLWNEATLSWDFLGNFVEDEETGEWIEVTGAN